jgi:hypothetical protein
MPVCLLLVSDILFIKLPPIFWFCPTHRDQQLVRHIRIGPILIILILFLNLLTTPFLSLQLDVLASPVLHRYVLLHSTYSISSFSPRSYMYCGIE